MMNSLRSTLEMRLMSVAFRMTLASLLSVILTRRCSLKWVHKIFRKNWVNLRCPTGI